VSHPRLTRRDAPVKIGVDFSVSGALAVYGVGYNNDTKLLIDELNANGGINGHPIEAYYADAASDPTTGVTSLRMLLDRDGVKLVIGDIYTPVALAQASLAGSEHFLFFTPGAAATGLTTSVQKYVFATNPTTQAFSAVIANLIASMGVNVRRVRKEIQVPGPICPGEIAPPI
jgi:branched-chain amino acid transport system substrate-binding protein